MSSVAIVIPACDEGPEFGANLVRLADYFAPFGPSYDLSFVIVDDGSTDGTLEHSRAFARYRTNVTVVSLGRRCGIGRALRAAFLRVCAKYTIVLDGSVTYGAAAAMELLEALESSGADAAIASPYMRGAHALRAPVLRRLGGQVTNRILSLLARRRFASFTCAVRAFRTEFLKRLDFEADGPEALPEMLFAAIRAGGRIVEMPTRRHWHFAPPRAAFHARSPFTIPQEGLPS